MSENKNKVRSLSKAIELLDILSSENGSITLSEISNRTGYPKSTVHALLSTMRDKGLIKQMSNGSYTLGIKLFEYGCAVSRSFDITALSRPYLEKLSRLTQSSAVISMFDNSNVVSFDYFQNSSGIQITPEIGSALPLHATSQGKLYLSTLKDSEIDKLLKRKKLIPYTPHTLIDISSLKNNIKTIRLNGYAIEDGEYKIGLRSVCAPVYDSGGDAKYALGIIGFFRRIESEDFSNAIKHTKEQAYNLSLALGYTKNRNI